MIIEKVSQKLYQAAIDFNLFPEIIIKEKAFDRYKRN
jgi:hypothetical protein